MLAILKSLGIPFTHVPPSEKISKGLFRNRFDAFILSDFGRKNLPLAAERVLVQQVDEGAGLLMVGGWGSFSGPSGGWHKSLVEDRLPVTCAAYDDRLNFPGGAMPFVKEAHTMLRSISFDHPPAIMGLNQVRPRKNASVLLAVRKVVAVGERLTLDPIEYPLLAVSSDPQKRIAAFTTDFAPHWCGGMVDWGRRPVRLSVNSKIAVEVGETYVQFVSSIVRWLSACHPRTH